MTISILTTSSVSAKVRDTKDLEGPLAAIGLDWRYWILIEETTLRAMKKDVDGYKNARVTLEAAQKKLEATTIQLNTTRTELHGKDVESYELKKRIMELEDVPVYKHPAFWCAVGAGGGILITAIIVGSVR